MGLMHGTYYEIVGGMDEDIIKPVSYYSDSKYVVELAQDTERVAYMNTYMMGERVESVKLYDPYNDETFPVNDGTLYYEPLSEDMRYRYSMLSRLKSDCDFYLGNGYGYEGHLWAGSVKKQIAEMRYRLNEFKDDEKPQWLTEEQIDNYEREMMNLRAIRERIYK